MKPNKTRFYADENIEQYLVDYLRDQGFHVYYAQELGFSPRNDSFHLQEARRRKSILITKNTDFLDHRKFPFHNLKDTGIVILRSEDKSHSKLGFGYMLVCLMDVIGASGNQNLFGLKIEIKGPKMIFQTRINGKMKYDFIDISEHVGKKHLFQN